MNLDNLFKAKLGPVPVWIIGVGGVGVAWLGYKYYKGKQGANGANPGGDGSIGSDPEGKFTGTNSITGGDGTTATMTSSGPLLTGAFVGQPGGYQYASEPGNVYVNIPGSPAQTTSQSTALPTYTVKTGDTLSKIARNYFGSSNLWRSLWQTNTDVIGNDPNRLTPGMVISIPSLTQADIAAAQQDNTPNPPSHQDSRGDDGNRQRGRAKSGRR